MQNTLESQGYLDMMEVISKENHRSDFQTPSFYKQIQTIDFLLANFYHRHDGRLLKNLIADDLGDAAFRYERRGEEIFHSGAEREGCTIVFHLTEILIIVAILQQLINRSSPASLLTSNCFRGCKYGRLTSLWPCL